MWRARNNEPTSELNFGGLRWSWYWYFPWIHTLVGFKMTRWATPNPITCRNCGEELSVVRCRDCGFDFVHEETRKMECSSE
jgi:hypothetical protein